MPRRRPADEQPPPADWTPTQAVDNPVINKPFEEPSSYWLYKGGVPSKVPGRRPARYYFKTQRIGAATAEMELFKEELLIVLQDARARDVMILTEQLDILMLGPFQFQEIN